MEKFPDVLNFTKNSINKKIRKIKFEEKKF